MDDATRKASATFRALEDCELRRFAEPTLRALRASRSARAQLLAAVALFRTGRLRKARAELSRALRADEPTGAFLLAAAALHFELGDFESALRCVERARAVPETAVDALRARRAMALAAGRHIDAIRAAEGLVAVEPRHAADTHAWLQRFLASEGNDEAALEHQRARVVLGSSSPDQAWADVALLCRLRRPDEARACVDRALRLEPSGPAPHVRAARLLVEAGAFDDAEREAREALHRDSDCVDALLVVAELQLWRGEAESALESSERAVRIDANRAVAHRQRAAACMLLDRDEDGLRAVDAALALDPSDRDAHTLRAELLVRTQRLEEALSVLEAHPFVDDRGRWIIGLLILRVGLRTGRSADLSQRELAPSLEPEALAAGWYELYRAIRDIRPDAWEAPSKPRKAAQIALIDSIRAMLRGNRSASPTRVVDGRLEYIPVRSPRDASVRALGLIRSAPPAAAISALDEVIAAYPDSSLPTTYRGELRLWLGDYEAARADLDSAIAQHERTRWAYYGLALLANVQGDPRDALAQCARGVRALRSEGPPIYAHRGEALRRLGHTNDAIRELRRACELSPARLSGRLNLALAEGDRGAFEAESSGFVWLRDQAPGLVSDAAFELGLEGALTDVDLSRDARRALLERMLVMMRGNRATSFATWLGPDGNVRVAGVAHGQPSLMQRLRDDEQNRWRVLRGLLERALRSR